MQNTPRRQQNAIAPFEVQNFHIYFLIIDIFQIWRSAFNLKTAYFYLEKSKATTFFTKNFWLYHIRVLFKHFLRSCSCQRTDIIVFIWTRFIQKRVATRSHSFTVDFNTRTTSTSSLFDIYILKFHNFSYHQVHYKLFRAILVNKFMAYIKYWFNFLTFYFIKIWTGLSRFVTEKLKPVNLFRLPCFSLLFRIIMLRVGWIWTEKLSSHPSFRSWIQSLFKEA